ncbi:MAG: hypothetical protein QG614_74 [Patescibacteria group bacterium]|nr:hypothetical protein [Patescibacteria group bacterium]
MEDFLTKNKCAHEPGIIITLDEAHTLKVEEHLLSKKFKTNANIQELAQEFWLGGNFYISSKKISDPVSVFDFVTGFSSGSVQINETFISPKYENLNFIMILSQDFIQSEETKGRNWLSLGGITIQSE